MRSRVSGGDAAAQRAMNAEAPRIPHLFRRIVSLFAAHKAAIITTMVLVLIGAALSVVPRCSPSAPSTRGCSRSPAHPTCRC